MLAIFLLSFYLYHLFPHIQKYNLPTYLVYHFLSSCICLHINSTKVGICPFYLLMYARYLEEYLTYNMRLVNICWMNHLCNLLTAYPCWWFLDPIMFCQPMCVLCTTHGSPPGFWITHSSSTFDFVVFTTRIRMACSNGWRLWGQFKQEPTFLYIWEYPFFLDAL